jgi:hypothetical protein
MIPYDELVAALDRYVARKNGAPLPAARTAAPVISAAPVPAYRPPASAFDEEHDPDLPPLQHEEDSTHVARSPGGDRPVSIDSHEIDIGDVLSDEEL